MLITLCDYPFLLRVRLLLSVVMTPTRSGCHPALLTRLINMSINPSSKAASSPCTSICKYVQTDKGAICSGCGRDYDDLEQWMYMSRDEKVACIKRCKVNLKNLAKN